MFQIQQFSIQILQSPKTFFVFGITLDNRILSSVCIKLLDPKERKRNVVTLVILKQDDGISIIIFTLHFTDFENCNDLHSYHDTNEPCAGIEQ